MIWPFKRKSRTSPQAVTAVYNAIVAQSRQPVFYQEWQVPDTLTGRFDMISLHMALVLRRLRQKDDTTGEFAQNLFDLFFADMDRSLREMGVTDLGVPRKISQMGGLFYGMLGKVTDALDSEDPVELEAVLQRNIYGGEANPNLTPLSVYVRSEADRLENVGLTTILSGKLTDSEAA